MNWINLLHFYQPADQVPEVIRSVSEYSYGPMLRSIKEFVKKPGSISLNINATLLEAWSDDVAYQDILGDLKYLLEQSIVELAGTGMYHPFFPILSEDEIIRQIKINDQVSRKILGSLYKPKGFFPQELGYCHSLAKIVAGMGYEWMVLDETSFDGSIGKNLLVKPYVHKKHPSLSLIFSQRAPAYLGIMRGVVMQPDDFYKRAVRFLKGENFLVTATDVEIYGYHRPGQEKAYETLLKNKRITPLSCSTFCSYFEKKEKILPIRATWDSLPVEIKSKFYYPFWQNPGGVIHKCLKQLMDLAILSAHSKSNKSKVRTLLDKALSSDAFWWGSQYKSWWSAMMIEKGARLMRDVVFLSTTRRSRDHQKAQLLYEKIVMSSLDWEFSGKMDKTRKQDFARMNNYIKNLTLLF